MIKTSAKTLILTLVFVTLSFSALSSTESHEPAGIDSKFIFSVINFVLLGIGLFYYLRKPIREFFLKRSQDTKSSIHNSKKIKDDALTQYQNIESRLNNIDLEAKELISSVTAQAEVEKSQLIDRAHTVAQKIKDDTKRILEQEVLKAKKELKEEALKLSLELATQKISQQITSEDQLSLEKEFVSQIQQRGGA